LEGHLPALKPGSIFGPGTRLLAFMAFAGGFAVTRSGPTAQTLPGFHRPCGRPNLSQFHAPTYLVKKAKKINDCPKRVKPFSIHHLFHDNQMGNLVQHPPNLGRITVLYGMMHPANTQRLEGSPLFLYS
jgi:hypothetical protein